MKHLIPSLFLSALPLLSTAQTMGEIWTSMPDSIVPYLSQEMRAQMLTNVSDHSKTATKNMLNETSIIDTMTADYASIRLNAAVTMQLKMLKATSGSTIVCMTKTYGVPAKESEVRLYNAEWSLLYDMDIPNTVEDLVVKPDTMSQEAFETLRKAIDPALVEASLSPSDTDLTISLNHPLASQEEKEQLASIISKRKLKWNGYFFK